MESALSALEKGIGYRAAAKQFNVARTTLQRYHQKGSKEKLEIGGQTSLSPDDEKRIKDDIFIPPLEPEERELLQLPPTPKRQNKRNIKRTPDVITSDENIDFLVSQQVEKRQKISEKNDRAVVREEKRKAKVAADIKKATKASEKVRLRLEKLTKKL